MTNTSGYTMDNLAADLKLLGVESDNDRVFRFQPGMVVEVDVVDGDSRLAIFVANGVLFYRMVILDEQGNGCLCEVPISHCTLTQVNGHWGLDGLVAAYGQSILRGEEPVFSLPAKHVARVKDIPVLIQALKPVPKPGEWNEGNRRSLEAVCEALYTRRAELDDRQRQDVLYRLCEIVRSGKSLGEQLPFSSQLSRWLTEVAPSNGWRTDQKEMALRALFLVSELSTDADQRRVYLNELCSCLGAPLTLMAMEELFRNEGVYVDLYIAIVECSAERWGSHQPREEIIALVNVVNVRISGFREASGVSRRLYELWGRFMADYIF